MESPRNKHMRVDPSLIDVGVIDNDSQFNEEVE